MVHPLDRRRGPKPKPGTHHVYRDTTPDEDGMPNALWLLRPSWRAIMLNLVEVIKLALMPLFFLVTAALLRFVAELRDGTTMEAVLNGLCGVAAFGVFASALAIMPGFGLIQLRSSRAEVAVAADEFHIGLTLLWRYTLVNILLGVLTLAGFLLLLLPGLWLLQRYQLAPFYVLDREMGVAQAMRAAAADARRYKRALWSLALVTFASRAVILVPYAGWVLAPLLQLLYAYAPAVRYVELTESARRRK